MICPVILLLSLITVTCSIQTTNEPSDVISITDNVTTIDRIHFRKVVDAINSTDYGEESSCVYNIPDSFTDILPQLMRSGIGYEFIRLAEANFKFETVLSRIIAPIVKDNVIEQTQTQFLNQKKKLIRKNREILRNVFIDSFETIQSAQICNFHNDAEYQFPTCDGVARTKDIFSEANAKLFYRLRVIDAYLFAEFQHSNSVNTSTQPEVGWWFGPTLCPSERYKMIYTVPLLKNQIMLIIEFNISSIDLDQCDPTGPFGMTNKCPHGTKCLSNPGHGFSVGFYNCVCTSPAGHTFSFDGHAMERQYKNKTEPAAWCPFTCPSGTRCFVKLSRVLRLVIICIQSFCIFLAMLEMVLVFRKRHNRAMKLNMWTLTEALLLGGICIYLSVVVLALDTTVITCIAYSWLREIGFITVYGTLILRLYKLLAEFQSRKARSVQIKNKDMVRYMLLMVLTASFYLLSWTLVNLDHATDPNIAFSLIYYGRTKSGHDFMSCQLRWWDYLVEIAEFVFLCTALKFLYCTKTAPPSEYKERKFIAFAIYLEISISTLCNLTRFVKLEVVPSPPPPPPIVRLGIWRRVHPDALLIIYFIRSHLTITTGILFNMYRRVLCSLCFDDEHVDDVRFKSIQDTVGETDFSQFKICNNGDVSSIAEMDPEIIKTELKRMYSQLHYLKTEQMKRYNPHLIRKTNRKKNRRISVTTLKHKAATNSPTAGPTSTPDIEITQHRTPRESCTSLMAAVRSEMT